MQLLPKPRKKSFKPQLAGSEQLSDQEARSSQAIRLGSPLTTPSGSNPPSAPETDSLTDPFLSHDVHDLSSQRVVVLIDGSNLFYATSYLNLEIDYVKLLRFLVKNRRLVRAYFYTGVDRGNDKQQGFLHWMRRNGYRVVAKDLIQFPDGSKKANVQVEIAVDMMTLADYCDTMVLLSGDGALTYAANAVTYRGVQIELVSLRSMTSDSLINVADRYTDLDTIKTHIQRF